MTSLMNIAPASQILIFIIQGAQRQRNRCSTPPVSLLNSSDRGARSGAEYSPDRGLDRQQLLRLATCAYIDEGHHVILKGASSSGKTYLACALGYAACTRFKKFRYVRMPELLDELVCACADNPLKKVSRGYVKVDLLILDEWLLRTLTVQQAFDLLEIIEARTKHGATVFCTQYDTDGWYERINADPNQDSLIADAIVDRIFHNPYALLYTGKTCVPYQLF